MSMICDMQSKPARSAQIAGKCANCGGMCYEREWILDDAYAVWMGRCPHCGALNYLEPQRGLWRGYDSEHMELVLPNEEERIMNDLPAGIPTRGWHDPANQGKTKEQLIAIFGRPCGAGRS